MSTTNNDQQLWLVTTLNRQVIWRLLSEIESEHWRYAVIGDNHVQEIYEAPAQKIAATETPSVKEFKIMDVVLVTDENEEWLGYCVGHEKVKGELTGRILVRRQYGMGFATITVPAEICS